MRQGGCAFLALMLASSTLVSCHVAPPADSPPAGTVAAQPLPLNPLRQARAHWLEADTLAWNAPANSHVRLYFSADAGLLDDPRGGPVGGDFIELTADGVIGGELADRFPHLAGMRRFRIAPGDLERVPTILRQQFALAAVDGEGDTLTATGIQHPGVLDDLYATDLPLGVSFIDRASEAGRPAERVPMLRVWAPTARSVYLHLHAHGASPPEQASVLPMQRDPATGTWSALGQPDWDRMYYQYQVDVFVRETGRFETHFVTDPYSLNLSLHSRRSQIIDLADEDLAPAGWGQAKKPPLAAPEDIVIYELHVRDFSIHDATVPKQARGRFQAFTVQDSDGVRHLRSLATAGLTHVHLLPAMDCASIPDDPADQTDPGDLAAYAPDSEEQQSAIAPIRDRDGFNWCYDPWHYTAPEGTYSSDPNGTERIREFRDMVAALHRLGLRVVMDVVYNHTPASGLADASVLDRIVPGYYHRLDAEGAVETSTCCANTATEHAMMERLMLDSLRTWAVQYRVDGFRFDLMGHHTRANIERARDRLQALKVETDGVDGRDIYLYGEGWNFGEVANDTRFEQATQANMGAGTGVGTFNDRLRDALRGGDHDDRGMAHVRKQGFINGLYLDPNGENPGSAAEREKLLQLTDLVRAGLAGSLADYRFVDRTGRQVTAAELDYHGQPAGYASDPQEVINYAAAHDNETLFDINQYKLPLDTGPGERVRVQNLANSVIALSQGIPFFHAGQEILRSKSLDRNSFNSGDWFNLLDFSLERNGWGRGLPPAWDNADNWIAARPRLADPALGVGPHHIAAALAHFQDMLRIRASSGLFRLRGAAEIQDRLAFHNTGPEQVPGLIVMSLRGDAGAEIVVLLNADVRTHGFGLELGGAKFELHPVQRAGLDERVREAAHDADSQQFTVPGRTAAVFVRAGR